MNKTEKGRRGEDIAAAYVMRCGMDIIARNYRYGKTETDIIAKNGDTYVFIEVKARSGYEYGFGAEAVNARKQKMLIHGALAFASEHRTLDEPMRFDVIEVDLKKGAVTLHIRDAFIAEEM